MWAFHLTQFARTGYFVQLLLTSLATIIALQALASLAPGASSNGLIWLQAGMVGTWTVSTISAGMLGFQRYQGTLIYLVRTPMSLASALFPLIGAASGFGLLAFPLAALITRIVHQPVRVESPLLTLAAGALFWLSCFAISLVIGLLFVLTPNALTYEPLLVFPLILVSGVFGTPLSLPRGVEAVLSVLPTRTSVSVLNATASGGAFNPGTAVVSLIASAVWIAAAIVLSSILERKIVVDGTLELT